MALSKKQPELISRSAAAAILHLCDETYCQKDAAKVAIRNIEDITRNIGSSFFQIPEHKFQIYTEYNNGEVLFFLVGKDRQKTMREKYTCKDSSPGKLAARSLFYSGVPRKELLSGLHITTCGDCGDVRHLLTCKAPPQHIVVCEADDSRHLLEQAKKYGVIISPYNLQETIQREIYQSRFGNHIASINADLCNNLVGGVPVLLETLKNINPNRFTGSIGYTYTKSYDSAIFHARNVPLATRSAYLASQLATIGWHRDPEEVVKNSFEYNSWIDTKKGYPMVMVNLTLKKEK